MRITKGTQEISIIFSKDDHMVVEIIDGRFAPAGDRLENDELEVRITQFQSLEEILEELKR